MGSTLRSLVLRYKADTKEFTKGNRSVINEIKQSKREVLNLDKEMRKAFDIKTDKARAQIKSLNASFQQGKIEAVKYGQAVDQLKQKIAAMNRVSMITSHEVGAIRAKAFATATAEKDLRSNFRGTLGESRESIRQRMSADVWPGAVGGGGGRGGRGQFGGGLAGEAIAQKITAMGGAGYLVFKIGKSVAHRGSELADGARSDTLGQLSSRVGGSFSAMRSAVKEVSGGFVDGLTGLVGLGVDGVTWGGASRYGAKVRRDEQWAAADRQHRAESYAKKQALDDARNPLEEVRAQQRINALIKDRSAAEVEAMASRAYQKGNLNDTVRLYAEAARLAEKEAAANQASEDAISAKADATREAIDQTQLDLEAQLRIAKDIARGSTPNEALVREAGGNGGDIAHARWLDVQIKKWRDAGRPATGNWLESWGDAAGDRMAAARQQAQSVSQFASQFATPQEIFQKNFREIQSMVSLGLDPAVARRAMMANARGLAETGGRFDRFAPAAEVGSRQEMAMREQAKAQGKQEKEIKRLVDVQEKALGELKKIGDGGGVKIEVVEVSF